MTEADAKARLCHRTIGLDPPRHCEGDACMAWGWLPGEVDRVFRERKSEAEPKPMQGNCLLKTVFE